MRVERLWHRGIFLLLSCGVGVVTVAMLRGSSSIEGFMALRKSRDVLQGTVSRLESENAELKREIIKLKESPSYARKVLRDRYHIVDQDENIVFFAE